MFTAFLVNDPAGDPGVYLEPKYRGAALLFDLGDIQRLPSKQIRKIRYIFVSHTHMDHFIGFDLLLRICLGRDQHIALYGPPGFLANVEGKLRAYTWNLVHNYTNDFELAVTETHPDRRIVRRYRCRRGFVPEDEETTVATSSAALVEEGAFAVHTAFLDHSIPSLAFSFEEKIRLNIKRSVLADMGLPTGAWISTFKNQIMNQEPEDKPVRIWWKNEEGAVAEKFMPLGLLQKNAVKVSTGQKICYISDAAWTEANIEKMVALARGAELLFIEAPFLDEDSETAARKHHLTARQAGTLASLADVKRLRIFHFSPKYKGMEGALEEEANSAFQKNR